MLSQPQQTVEDKLIMSRIHLDAHLFILMCLTFDLWDEFVIAIFMQESVAHKTPTAHIFTSCSQTRPFSQTTQRISLSACPEVAIDRHNDIDYLSLTHEDRRSPEGDKSGQWLETAKSRLSYLHHNRLPSLLRPLMHVCTRVANLEHRKI